MNEDFNLKNELKNNIRAYNEQLQNEVTEFEKFLNTFFEEKEDEIYDTVKYALINNSKQGDSRINIKVETVWDDFIITIENKCLNLNMYMLIKQDANRRECVLLTAVRLNQFLLSLKSIDFKVQELNINDVSNSDDENIDYYIRYTVYANI